VAKIAVRVTELRPDGRSWLVSYGLRNLTHRGSDRDPRPLIPGEFYDVEFPMFMVGHRFRKGSRIRVAISENLWPLAWPSPEIANLTLDLSRSRIELPVRPQEAAAAPFPIPVRHGPPANPAPVVEVTTAPVSPGHYLIELDSPPKPSTLADIGTTVARGRRETCELFEGQPNSGRWRQEASSSWARGAWDCSISATIELKSTPTEFLLTEELSARQGDATVFKRRSEARILRRLV